MKYLTRAQALEQGFTVDNHAPGRPMAYKGSRFAPTAVQPVHTEMEEQLLAAYRALRHFKEKSPCDPDVADEQFVAFQVWQEQHERIKELL